MPPRGTSPPTRAGWARTLAAVNRRHRSSLRHLAALAALGLLAVACSGADAEEAATTTAATTSTSPVPTTSPATTTPATAAPSTIPPSTLPPGTQRVSFAFSGDILIHSNVWLAAQAHAGGVGYDFAPMFADLQPLLDSVDLAVCHLEVPLAKPGNEPSTYPRYGAPRELIARHGHRADRIQRGPGTMIGEAPRDANWRMACSRMASPRPEMSRSW